MNVLNMTIDLKLDEMVKHANDSITVLEQTARESAQRLHILGLNLEVSVRITDRNSQDLTCHHNNCQAQHEHIQDLKRTIVWLQTQLERPLFVNDCKNAKTA